MNICEHLTATARLFPDRDAIRFEGSTFTYAALDRMSHAASQNLTEAGIQPGDRVAIMLPNVPAFAVWYYAALRLGAIAVSMSTRSAASEIGFLVDDCGAKFFVTDDDTLPRIRSELPICVTHAVTTSDFGDTCLGVSLTVEKNVASDWVAARPNDPATILYTSGTTGFAKGATLSHMNVRSNVNAFNHLCNMQPCDRILLAVPLFHCFGQNALLNSVLNVGATLILQRRFDLYESKRLIADEQVTQLYGVPMMFQLLLDSCTIADLKTVSYCFSAAATLPMQVGDQWRQKFDMPINEGYGLTETSPFASYNHRLKFVPGSIGTPIDAVEMKIVDTETGEECLPGTLGEIVVRGPNVMLGYWNREEDTAAAIRDGWFHSGDIGRIDERGFFYIVDRVKDMIVVGGLKVYPAEVERVLLDQAMVTQAAVVGLEDDVFGEQVVAFVVFSERGEDDDAATLQTIKQHAQNHLANYKVPRIVVRIDELPRNASGKVLKRKLREYDLQVPNVAGDLEDSDDSERQSASQLRSPSLRKELETTHATNYLRVATHFVQQLVQEISQTDEMTDANERFLDVGLDSLMIVEMSNQIQVELGSKHDVPPTLVFDHPRICDLSEFLVAALTDQPASLPASADVSSDVRDDVDEMSEEDILEALMKELDS